MKRYLIILGILGLLICEQAYGMETAEFQAPPSAPVVTRTLQQFERANNIAGANRYMEFLQKAGPRDRPHKFFGVAQQEYQRIFKTPWGEPAPPREEKKKKAAEEKKKAAAVNFEEVKTQAGAVKTQGQMVVKQAANLPAGQKDELANAIGFTDFASMQTAWQ